MIRTILCFICLVATPADDIFADPKGYWVEVIATAYSPFDEIDHWYHGTKGKDRWMTAGQRDVRKHHYGVAVPRDAQGTPRIPYGSKIWIPLDSGYLTKSYPRDRFFIADDTGGTITTKTRETGVIHIDLRYWQESWALKYGRQRFWVFIIPPVGG